MSTSGLIQFQVQVADSEQKGVIAGVQQLIDSLRDVAIEIHWLAQVEFERPGKPIVPVPSASIIMLSLLPDVELLDEPIKVTEARWHELLQPLLEADRSIYLRTVFRHVPTRQSDVEAPLRLERIRRLNRMAADLSYAYGLGVIDIDRAFAHIGGDILHTDWRLHGPLADEVAGHTMAWSLLSYGLDDLIDPAIQEKARESLGDLNQINDLLAKRLAPADPEDAAA